MAIKGNGYTKTTWTFQERPVASSKLNQWDDRIESALELVYFLITLAWGAGNGVLRAATIYNLETLAMSPPGMSVKVMPGYAFIVRFPYKLAAITETVAVTPPITNPRIDLVQARLSAWDITLKTGVESESPLPPNRDQDCLVLANLYLRPGMTCIKDTDDSVNGYIIDARVFV